MFAWGRGRGKAHAVDVIDQGKVEGKKRPRKTRRIEGKYMEMLNERFRCGLWEQFVEFSVRSDTHDADSVR